MRPSKTSSGSLDRIGHIPLPPYIHREDESADRDRYQTVFSRERGSVAAPTAGLHFTPQMLEQIAARGVEIARVTLHVGLGTFAPLRVERVDEVRLHRERYSIPAETADARESRTPRTAPHRRRRHNRSAHPRGGSAANREAGSALLRSPLRGDRYLHCAGISNFKSVGALLTNFHLPQSSLLMLVSAFAGRENVLAAYRHAVDKHYRFFSYGDCMFLA